MILILGLGCSSPGRIIASSFIVAERPAKLPKIQDGSPLPCPECTTINEQRMYKFTERDFISDKKKHIEKDDYIDYLLDFLK